MRTVLALPFLFFPVAVLLGEDAPPALLAEKVLFDFEGPDDLKAWSNLELPGASGKEPVVKLERSAEHSTSRKHSLKLTFAGGSWPTVTTTQVLDNWLAFQTFRADVTVSRPCVVGFTALQEKSKRGAGWDDLVSRWTKTAFLHPGKNQVVAAVPQPNEYAISARWGKVVRFEIFMHRPREGESIYVDNIRLTKEKIGPRPKMKFTVAGTDLVLPGASSADAVIGLGKRFKGRWTPPKPLTLEQVEADFKGLHAELKAKHPRALLAVLRDGERDYDPDHPDKVYAGWKDAYWSSHGPDGATLERAANRGKAASHEVFMRHRSPLMRVDLSSILAGSNILAAQLIVIRANEKVQDDHNPLKKPTMWVVEPCNRPWQEYEVNAYEYARDRFWKAIGGMSWGADPDFLPIFLAHGPGLGKVNVWDFTLAVRHWTDGKHPNHCFMLHGDSHDYMIAHSREAKEIRNRPAVLVIYEPKLR
jgi:hypothetical protein